MIYVKVTYNKGRGVFASQDIRKDTIVIADYYIVESNNKIEGTLFDNYVYSCGDGKNAVMALGYASLLNHNVEKNCTFNIEDDRLVVKTKYDIAKDEELLIDYQWSSYHF